MSMYTRGFVDYLRIIIKKLPIDKQVKKDVLDAIWEAYESYTEGGNDSERD